METLGQRLKHVRGGLSQQAVADKLGIPQTTWGNYERGRCQPDLALLDKMCAIFAVKSDWLLFGRGPMRKDVDAAPEQAAERRIKMRDVLNALRSADDNAEEIEDPELRAAALKLQRHVADLHKQLEESRAAVIQAQNEALKAYRLAVDAMRPASAVPQFGIPEDDTPLGPPTFQRRPFSREPPQPAQPRQDQPQPKE